MHTKRTRILAIDPGTRELGVAILEGEDLLFYGVKTVQRRTTPEEVLREITRIIKQLIDHYAPAILAIEKVFLIQKNASLLIVATDQIKAAARKEGLVVYEYEPKVIRKFICQTGKAIKREVAKHLTQKYYELYQYLNRKSRWERNPSVTGGKCKDGHYWANLSLG
jgi:crossover junction endodeoxyribonuclease RuvC